jgi:hypothetical protein
MKVLILSCLVVTIAATFFFAFSKDSLTVLAAPPQTPYEAFSAMTSKHERVLAINKETAEAKSSLWKQHMALSKTNISLNEEQVRVLDDFAQALDAQFFADAHGVTEADYIKAHSDKPIAKLMPKIPQLFSKDEIRRFFLVVGDTSSITDWSCVGAQPDASGRVAQGGCNCLGATFCSTGCESGVDCGTVFYPPRLACVATPDGCGCGGFFSCTGTCGLKGGQQK